MAEGDRIIVQYAGKAEAIKKCDVERLSKFLAACCVLTKKERNTSGPDPKPQPRIAVY